MCSCSANTMSPREGGKPPFVVIEKCTLYKNIKVDINFQEIQGQNQLSEQLLLKGSLAYFTDFSKSSLQYMRTRIFMGLNIQMNGELSI